MNIKDSYLHGGTHVMKNIKFSIAASGTNQNKLVATITWAEEGSSDTELAIPINGATFGSLTKNTVLAAPNGSAGVPSFRALVADDIPNLGAGKITSGEFAAARLPLATNSAKGAVILGVAKTSDADSAITGKKYWVKMNANGKLFVDIPWTDHTYTVNNATFSIKSKIGTNDAVTLSDFTANLSTADDFTLIQGSNITFTNDATNRTLTIAGTANTWKAANASQEGYVPKSTANKILRANADGALYWGDDANTTYTFYNLQFQNSSGTTVDTYKPTTSPTKTLKAGSNVTISAASNVITIASTNTWNAMTGATSSANGTAGYVNAIPPKDGYNTKFLRADGTWSIPAYPTKSSWNYNDMYVSSITTSGNSLRWVKNGSNNDITIPYATSANIITRSTSIANAEQLDNFHSTGLKWAQVSGILNPTGDYINNDDGFIISIPWSSNTYGLQFYINDSGYTIMHRFCIQKLTSAEGVEPKTYGRDWKNWVSILDTANSSVSKSGETLTVKIGGTSQSLTNTWRGIQNNLTSSSNTTESLSAKQGYLLANGSARDSTKVLLDSGTAEQTIKSSASSLGIGVIQLWRANTGYSMIGFANGTTKTNLGMIGFSAANTLIFRNTSNNDYTIAHAGNITDKAATITSSSTTLATIAGKNITAKLPTNAKSTAGIVAGPGAAGKVYISDSSGAPTWDTFDTTVTSGSAHLITSGAVYTAIANNVASAVQYQGTVASEADMIALTNAGQGDFARVTTAFTFTDASGASVTAHVGDVVYLTNNTPGTAANWIVAHTEIDTNTWTAASTSAAGYVPKLVTGGANLAAASTDYVLAFTNGATSPSWLKLPANAYKNDNTTGIKLATVSGTKKTDSTLISIDSGTGLSIAGGTNKFSIGNGTNYIEVSVAHGLSTKNISINGTNYALYTSASSLPTIKAPTGFGTANLILATNADATGLTWVDKPATNVTTSLYVGASNGTSTAAQSTNGNVYLILKEGSTYTRYNITGSGRASVTSDANGKITINSSGYSNFVKSGSGAAAGLVPAPSTTAGTGKFLCEDGTWKTPSYTTNTDRTGIKLAAVSGTQKTDGTVIIANSSTGLSIAGGTNKFSIGDGTNYIEVAVTPSITNNVTGSGTSGKLVKWNGANTITDGPALSSSISSLSLTTKFLREDGTWAAPSYTTDTVRPIYTGGTSRFTNSQKTAINFVGAGATSVTYEAAGTGSGQSGNASYASIKISSNNDLVKFSAITANTEYYLPVRAKNTTDTAQLLYRTSIIVKDSTITATLSGNATTASNLLTTSRGFLYVNANNTVSYSGYGTRDTSKIGIPYVHHTSTSNDTYVLAEDLFYKSGSDKYIGNNIRSNKFACIKSKDSTTDDWDGSSTSGSSGSGSTTYSAGDGISISNGVISSTKKEWYGTEALFNSLASLDSNTTYYIMN